MDPTTTTEPATQEPGAPVAQLEEQPATAVTTPDPEPTPTTEQPEPTTEEPAPADNSSEEDHAAWLASKGIDLSTPEGQAKAAKSWREAEKAMTQKSQAASELAKQLQGQPVSVETDNPLVQELAQEVVQMKRAQNVAQFASEVKLTAEQEQKMSDYFLKDAQAAAQAGRHSKVDLVNAGYMTLQEVYQLSGAAGTDPETIKRQGGQAALERLANKQLTTAPTGNATTATTPTVDPIAAALAD